MENYDLARAIAKVAEKVADELERRDHSIPLPDNGATKRDAEKLRNLATQLRGKADVAQHLATIP